MKITLVAKAVGSLVATLATTQAKTFRAGKAGGFWPRAAAPRNCTLYSIQPGDSCFRIASEHDISYAQLTAWNPDLDSSCTDLSKLKDPSICLSNPSGKHVFPTNTYGQAAVVKAAAIPVPTPSKAAFNQAYMVSLPSTGPMSAKYSSSLPVIPIAKGTRLDCWDYLYYLNVTDNSAANCWAVAMIYEITDEELILWNPSLKKKQAPCHSASTDATATTAGSCTPTTEGSNPYAYPCSLAASSSYCVRLMSPSPAQASTYPGTATDKAHPPGTTTVVANGIKSPITPSSIQTGVAKAARSSTASTPATAAPQ